MLWPLHIRPNFRRAMGFGDQSRSNIKINSEAPKCCRKLGQLGMSTLVSPNLPSKVNLRSATPATSEFET